MDSLLQDIRYAARGLLRRPGFTLAVVVTLALGIGANSAIFSFLNGVLLRPLPFPNPDRLMVLWTNLPNWGHESASYPDFLDWKGQTTSFSAMSAYTQTADNLAGGDGEPERVASSRVTHDFLSTLGVRPQLGRDFQPTDAVFGSHQVVMLSHGLWQRRFGGNPSIVGQTVTLNSTSYEVIGVAPPEVRFTPAQLWSPFVLNPANPTPGRRADFLYVVARLKPGVTEERAQSELDGLAKRLEADYAQTNTGVGIDVLALHDELVGPIRKALLLFAGAVGLVLLVACANVANLLLARAATRDKEMAVRVSLGAGRARIMRQLLTESVLLAVLGGALGLLLAVWGIEGLKVAAPDNVALVGDIGIDGWVLAFTAAVSLVTGVLFGLAPAARVSSSALTSALSAGGRAGVGGPAKDRLRNSLVLSQVALALVLLAGAGLLLRSFEQLQRVDLGFQPENVLAAQVAIPAAKYPEQAQVRAFLAELKDRMAALPGVRGASITSDVPLDGGYGYITFQVAGRAEPTAGDTPDAVPTASDADYFRVLGVPMREGRLFGPEDREGVPRVAIVNEEMVRKHFDGKSPLGERITFGDPADSASWMTIVGVVGDTRLEGVGRESYPQVFMPAAQTNIRNAYVAIKTSGDPLAIAPALRRELAAIDPAQPISDLRTMDQRVDASIQQPRVNSLLVAAFAALALLLAAIGIYAVMSYTIVQRTRELGIRMALGATGRDVLGLVVKQGMAPALLGVGLGLVAAFAAMRLLASLLYGISASDPLTFAAVASLLLVVAFVACVLPARRAARVDPLDALRAD